MYDAMVLVIKVCVALVMEIVYWSGSITAISFIFYCCRCNCLC